VFQTKTKERGKVAVRGFAELRAQAKLWFIVLITLFMLLH
jgi:hypothetical protein